MFHKLKQIKLQNKIFPIFIFGVIIGYFLSIAVINNKNIDYVKRVEQIMSCKSFENKFLYSIGFSSREDCYKFNLELYDEYVSSCKEVLVITENRLYNQESLNSCVYYFFAKARVALDTEYYVFNKTK